VSHSHTLRRYQCASTGVDDRAVTGSCLEGLSRAEDDVCLGLRKHRDGRIWGGCSPIGHVREGRSLCMMALISEGCPKYS